MSKQLVINLKNNNEGGINMFNKINELERQLSDKDEKVIELERQLLRKELENCLSNCRIDILEYLLEQAKNKNKEEEL